MAKTPEHIKWLSNTGNFLKTSDGRDIEIWVLNHKADDKILSAWARHFRRHYCLDTEIDILRDGTGLSRRDYLLSIVFPDSRTPPGPSLRSGDFAEILIADYLEFMLSFWVPRQRYDSKNIRNESTKGSDVIGFKFAAVDDSPDDILVIYEAKAKLSGTKCINRLQKAVNDSEKDYHLRKAESLNALKRRFVRNEDTASANKIKRFQNKSDRPYIELSGAAAIFSTATYDRNIIQETDVSSHPNVPNLKLIVIKGDDMMTLAHGLYRRAADEA
ncbi:MAG: hypothetical protein BWY28_01209 [bacterium ADurb.Bin236]|nr:MAG: hypothetical protein BWY28_01209 [bacterium ADurb.Bin236]